MLGRNRPNCNKHSKQPDNCFESAGSYKLKNLNISFQILATFEISKYIFIFKKTNLISMAPLFF